jgi:hypothetical protein
MSQGATLQLAEKCTVLKGHEFTRAANTAKSIVALAAEGCFWPDQPQKLTFSASCSVVPKAVAKRIGL